MIRDDEVQTNIKTKIKPLDPDVAVLFFALFRKIIVGGKYTE